MEESKQATESKELEEIALPPLPGTSFKGHEESKVVQPQAASPVVGLRPTARGVENARKMLRAFCIQKKGAASAASVTSPKQAASTKTTTVLIGKLSSAKPIVKPDKVPDAEKIPKPPKPGQQRKAALESYEEQQKKTQAEIEHMKRKLEMVELGIPLGLLCPGDSHRAMPTKAMPPIKTFLDIEKVDEIIREAKKAKAEGREFKFDYNKFVPDYTNPFQRKRDEEPQEGSEKKIDRDSFITRRRERDRRSSSRFDRRYDRKEDKGKNRDMERAKSRDSNTSRDRDEDKSESGKDTPKGQETKVNLNDYLVCDSWSLENEDKASISSPHTDDKPPKAATSKESALESPSQPKDSLSAPIQLKSPAEQLKDLAKTNEKARGSPDIKPPILEKLKPVMDSFKFEIDPDDDDEELDIFNEDNDLQKYTKVNKKDSFDSPATSKFDYQSMDESFLESVINEIKQDTMSAGDSDSQDKGLVGYDSPAKLKVQGSVTPELDDSFRSTYSDGRRSVDSRKSVESFKSSDTGYRSSDTGYRSTEVGNKTPELGNKSYESGRKSSERSRSVESGQSYTKTEDGGRKTKGSRRDFSASSETDLGMSPLESGMSKSTVDSLEMWSFVLKICQPLLFRHDRNKCYKETRAPPALWYCESPKGCGCVKDRGVVYEELEMCKGSLIDRVYGCDQIIDPPLVTTRTWYPREDECLVETAVTPPIVDTTPLPEELPCAGIEPGTACEWEGDDKDGDTLTLTPEKKEDLSLDIEYQRFMQAVWPEVAESKETKDEPSGSTTPVPQERKKKISEDTKEQKKGAKKIKLDEDWSQESEVDEAVERSKKRKKKQFESAFTEREKEKEKVRKRKRSSSTLSSVSSEDDRKKRKIEKMEKKKDAKKKLGKAKRRRLEKKVLKKLKNKKRKKLKEVEKEDTTDFEEAYEKEPKKKGKKIKKKKSRKVSKPGKKKKKRVRSSSSSDSSSSSSDSESESDRKGKKRRKEDESRKKKKTKKKKKKRHIDSESNQSDELFDVNVLNNIKTERTEPRPLPRPIINVNTLQDDFSSTVKIKQEAEEEKKEQQAEKKRKEETKEDKFVEKETEKESVQEVNSHQLESSASEIHKLDTDTSKPNVSVIKESKTQIDISASKIHQFNASEMHLDTSIKSANSIATEFHQTDSNASEIHQSDSKASVMHQIDTNASVIHRIESNANVMRRVHTGEQDFSLDVDVDAKISYQPQPLSPRERESAIPPPAYDRDATTLPSHYDGYKAPAEEYGQDNYEMYEQLAMAYQSDVANQSSTWSGPGGVGGGGEVARPIETVVRSRVRGEIKCDWRAGAEPAPATPPLRPSRWGLKPGEVNIVLTGGGEDSEPVGTAAGAYRSPGAADQHTASTDYDEAYEVTYGAADRLQYGRCFGDGRRSLDDRIDTALRDSVLGEVAKDTSEEAAEKASKLGRPVKRVSFADGYKPGQDSDVEEPPVKKRKRPARLGCAWPCPPGHADHVALWDALPPPPPPPGSPPPPQRPGPPLHLLRPQPHYQPASMPGMPPGFDPSHPMMSKFMPPEPPPGLISFT